MTKSKHNTPNMIKRIFFITTNLKVLQIGILHFINDPGSLPFQKMEEWIQVMRPMIY